MSWVDPKAMDPGIPRNDEPGHRESSYRALGGMLYYAMVLIRDYEDAPDGFLHLPKIPDTSKVKHNRQLQ